MIALIIVVSCDCKSPSWKVLPLPESLFYGNILNGHVTFRGAIQPSNHCVGIFDRGVIHRSSGVRPPTIPPNYLELTCSKDYHSRICTKSGVARFDICQAHHTKYQILVNSVKVNHYCYRRKPLCLQYRAICKVSSCARRFDRAKGALVMWLPDKL